MRALSPGAWASYLARYHDEHAGITEEVLSVARDGAGRSPYDWLLEAVPDRGLVVDIGCGSAPVARRLRGGPVRYVGVDRSAAELRRARGHAAACAPVARADAAALPLPHGAADAVVASMMLMVVPDVDAVLAEAGRVLRVGGRLVGTVPVRGADDNPSTDVFREVLAALGQGDVTYPGSLKPSTLPSRLAAAGLELLEDTCGRFARTVGPDDCELVVDSFYAVGASHDQGADALARLRARAEAEPFLLTYPIRRVVAIRGDG